MSSLPLSPQEAAQHLLNRRRARTDVVQYAGVIDVPGRPLSDDPECELFAPVETHLAAHHVLTLRAMERTAARRYGRLMVFMPPGSAKTTYASVVFPSHYLGAEPGRRVLLASYGDLPAKRMGRRTRSIIKQVRYQRILGAALSRESSAAEQFVLTNGSEYLASSIAGSITSYRADGAIIDDPVKGRAQASSELEQNATWDAYMDDVCTRLVPGGWLVLIMTRWAQDDLAGRILPEDWSGASGMFECRDGRTWEVLCLQAKCETQTDPLRRAIGEYLWPEWFDRDHWTQYEREPLSWNSLFQQRPRPHEGAFFHENDLLVADETSADQRHVPVALPTGITCVFAIIDTAVKTGKDHDGLAVAYFGVSRLHGIPLTILDWDLTQIEGAFLEAWLPNVFRRLEELAQACRPIHGSAGALIEDKAAGMVLLQQAKNKGWPAEPIDSKLTSLGKVERAVNVSGYVHAGHVKLTKPAYEKMVTYKGSTRNHLLSQLLAFNPSVKDQGQDDLLDCVTYGIAVALGNPEGF